MCSCGYGANCVLAVGLVLLSSSPCGSQVPFGRARTLFSIGEVDVGKTCCFRQGREAKRNGGGGIYLGDVRQSCVGAPDNRVSGCMSVAGYEYGAHHRLMVRIQGSRRGGVYRARGSDGSPRNGWKVSDGRARGIAAEMVSPFRRTGGSFNDGSCLGETEIPLDAVRLAEW